MTATTSLVSNAAGVNLDELFRKQQSNLPNLAQSSARDRIEKVNRIWAYLESETNFQVLAAAMHKDFRKSPFEVWATEIGIVKQAVLTVRRQLRQWMQDKYVPGSVALAGMRSYVHYEPKGNCLIMSPWNYPITLSLVPFIYGIAAGNAVILKPSEMAPHTSGFLARMIREIFPAEEAVVVEGDAAVAQALLELPFNHIFFTGSPAIGKIVMAAAAKHLASVTLELGGKSPVIIDESADVAYHAEKLVWAKMMNNGQTCIAPDHVLVHESRIDELIAGLRKNIARLYGDDPQKSPDLARLINDRHYQRIRDLVREAVHKGARIEMGGEHDDSELYFAPTVLTHLTEDMHIMHEEIFGPVLPVIPFRTREEAVEIIRRRPKPLDLYIGSRSNEAIRYFIGHTSAGNTVVNEYMTSVSNPNLPFGGVNNSGIGKSGGKAGFEEFSNARSIMRRYWLFSGLKMIQPPFSDAKMKLLKFFYRFA